MKQVIIAGNVGKSAELRRTPNGDPVAGFSVAVTDRKKETTWFDCSIWGKRADALSQYINKGDKITVAGELGTREYEGKTYLTVNVSEITLMGGKPSEQPQQGAPAGGNDLDDEIPFAPEFRG